MVGVKSHLLRLLLIFGILGVTSARISWIFQKGVGWQVSCDWTTAVSDPQAPLQNVTISRNEQENFVVFYPAQSPLITEVTTGDAKTKVNCTINPVNKFGICTLLVAPNGPTTADTYTCVVSYGLPHSDKLTSKETVIEKAPRPQIKEMSSSGQKAFNCSTSGVPAPQLVWTAEKDAKGTMLKGNSSNAVWNATTKLWDSWSVFKPEPNARYSSVFCTSQQFPGEQVVTTASESHSLKSAGWIHKSTFLAAALPFFFLISL